MTKEFILSEIKRTAEENGGKPLGTQKFYLETGIKKGDWFGKFWSRWNVAIKEVGLEPNSLVQPIESQFLLLKLAELVTELKRFPANSDLRLKATNNKDFPSASVFDRFGNKEMLVKTFKDYCIEKNNTNLLQYIPEISSKKQTEDLPKETEINQDGFVYLYQAGKHYKIGRTNDINRRDREINLQLPVQANLIHRITTDDPVGIEKYWHSRFASKRLNGEWFNLLSSDIKAFKRRKFM